MAQSRHGIRGELRIPKNDPYYRVRHIDWNDDADNDVYSQPQANLADHEERDRGEDSDDEDGHDAPRVWTF